MSIFGHRFFLVNPVRPCYDNLIRDKAKLSARVGRKAAGLAGETPELSRFGDMHLLDSRVAEVHR
jgi:hypothetical protein